MLTLADIDRLTNSHDGAIYSDLYKDVYGSRPRYAQFESVKDFDQDFNRLSKMLAEKLDEDKIRQARNFEDFVQRVEDIRFVVDGCTRERAIEIIAEAEDEVDGFECYGYERLEWVFDLKFGSIKRWLDAWSF